MSLKNNRKFQLGGTPRFKQLQPGEECLFVKGSIPEEFESEWDTGYGKNKNSKWTLTFTLLKHPHPSYSSLTNVGSKGIEVIWETTAEVIRKDFPDLYKTNKEFVKYWNDSDFIWTLERREDGSYAIGG